MFVGMDDLVYSEGIPIVLDSVNFRSVDFGGHASSLVFHFVIKWILPDFVHGAKEGLQVIVLVDVL